MGRAYEGALVQSSEDIRIRKLFIQTLGNQHVHSYSTTV